MTDADGQPDGLKLARLAPPHGSLPNDAKSSPKAIRLYSVRMQRSEVTLLPEFDAFGM